MAAAADLLQAANEASANLFPLWTADTLQTKVTAFWRALNDQFDEQNPKEKPIGNWLAVIAAFAPTILDFVNAGTDKGIGSIDTYEQAVDYIYRFCKFAYYYRQDNFITAPQAALILAAYNAQFT